MAQLVKLQDYISRYQIDLARYPTQFVRLKKSQWERVKYQWQTGEEIGQWEHIDVEGEQELVEKTRFSLLKKLLPVRQKEIDVEDDIETMNVSTELDEDTIF